MIDRKITISNLETNIRWIEDYPQHQFPGWGNVTMSMRDALELLKEQPEIIRCKDCKHYDQDTGRCYWGVVHGNAETWFCADGEKKDD